MNSAGSTYCRRCGRFQPRESGVLIKVRMSGGQLMRQFVCGICQARRIKQRTAKQASKEHAALLALYGKSQEVGRIDATNIDPAGINND
jgi:hypothetical protein